MTFEEAGQHLSLALEAAVSRYGAMAAQSDLVEVVATLKQILCVKG